MEGTNDMQSRIKRFRELLERNPGARYFAPLADLLRQEGRHDEALRLLGEGLQQHHNYLAGLVIQGRTLQEVGRDEEALEIWQQVRRIDPDNILALEFLVGRAVERQDWERAEPLLEQLCRLLPEDTQWCRHLEQVRRQSEQQRMAAGAAREQAAAAGEHGDDASESAEPEPLAGGGSFETMTLVDIYLAQGYRDQALSVLQRMLPGSGAARPKILERIRLLQNVEEGQGVRRTESERLGAQDSGAGTGPVPEGAGPAAQTSTAAAAAKSPRRLAAPELEQRQAERAQRREEERRQFEAWLARIRLDGEEN